MPRLSGFCRLRWSPPLWDLLPFSPALITSACIALTAFQLLMLLPWSLGSSLFWPWGNNKNTNCTPLSSFMRLLTLSYPKKNTLPTLSFTFSLHLHQFSAADVTYSSSLLQTCSEGNSHRRRARRQTCKHPTVLSLSHTHTHTLPGTSSIRTQRVYPVGFQPNPVGFLELKPIWVCFSFFYNLKKTNLGLVFFLPLCLQLL
jgi:hypothetical protein